MNIKRDGRTWTLMKATSSASMIADPTDLGLAFVGMTAAERMVVIGSLVSDGDPLGGATLARAATLLNAVDDLAEAKKRIEQLEGITNHFTDNVDPETFDAILDNQTVGRLLMPDEIDEDPSDECKHDWIGDTNECRKCGGPETDKLRGILADVAQIAFTEADDASAAVLKIQMRLRAEPVNAAALGVRAPRGIGFGFDPTHNGVELPSPRDSMRVASMHASGITAAEFAEGVAKFPKPAKLPTAESIAKDFDDADRFGTVVAKAGFWLLDKLWSHPRASK